MRDPRPAREYDAASARAKDIGKHLGESLASTNAYERLFALDYVGRAHEAVTAEIAPRLAALIADRTKVLSLHCQACISGCSMCDACWGLYGNSDCGWLRELRVYAEGPLTALAKGPLRAALADALWTIALRSDADAAAVAPLMAAYGEALRGRVRPAIDGPDAAATLRLLVSFPPGQCGDTALGLTLSRRVADATPAIRARAALAILVCGDGSDGWKEPARAAVAELRVVLADPHREILEEMPAIAPVVLPLARAIGLRMADRAAADGRHGIRLLRAVPPAASEALPGLRARLKVADVEESAELLMLIDGLGRKAASLKSAVIGCARRKVAGYWAIIALGAMRARLSQEERAILRRALRSECRYPGIEDCASFANVMAEAYGRPRAGSPVSP
jgi:hypothetical protein